MVKRYLPHGAARDEIAMRFVKLDRDNDRRKLYRRFKKRDHREAMRQAEQDIIDYREMMRDELPYYNDMDDEEYDAFSDWYDNYRDELDEPQYDYDPYYHDPYY